MPVDPTDTTKPRNTDPIGDPDLGIQVEMRALKEYLATQVARITAVESAGATAEAVGSLKMWPSSNGATIPAKWRVCHGAAISRTTFSDLFDLIGLSFGSGDGISTFNLPDFRSRSPLGHGQGAGLSNRILGANLGEETHTQTVGEMPTHAHGFDHETASYGTGGNNAEVVFDAGTGGASLFNTETTGDGTPFNVLHPVLVINFIIKVQN